MGFSKVNQIWRWSASKSEHWAPITIRLIVGYGFMAHGYAKLVTGPEHFVGILHALGVPMPELMGWVTIVVELVGGLAVLMGAFVSLVSVPMAAVLPCVDVYRGTALRFPLDQAAGGHVYRGSIREARL